MTIERNYDLTKLNTFGVPARARFFTVVESESDFQNLMGREEFKNSECLFLGSGSNVLLTKDFPGIVVLNKIKGVKILKEDQTHAWVRAMSGEIWHDLVLFVAERGYWGIENLAFIPGSVGAAPMQNIGAYGAELKDTLESVETLNIETGEKKIFHNQDCAFGYRNSIFKEEIGGKYFILAITLKLHKTEKKNVSYKILREYLLQNKIEVKTPRDVSDAVTAIRKSKLPDPAQIGNAGSFFKNVFVSMEKFQELQKKYPDIPHFEENNQIKIPTAWLIEQTGPADSGTSWKGHRRGDVGVHDRQALVLVNHGSASGEEIKMLAEEIAQSVLQKFGLKIMPEVNFIP